MTTDFLGRTVRDRITGFRGVVTGQVAYITGCTQLLVAPPAVDGSMKPAEWIDQQRCEVDGEVAALTLDNGPTPGCDRAPPRR